MKRTASQSQTKEAVLMMMLSFIQQSATSGEMVRGNRKLVTATQGSGSHPLYPRLLVLALFVAQFATTAPGAEDPTRFLLVTNWYATFTHSLSENGNLDYVDPNNGDNCSASWHFNHSMTVSCQLAPDPQGHSDPEFLEFFWKQNDSASIQFSDTFDQTCCSAPDVCSHARITVNDLGLAPTNFIVNIDLTEGTYQIRWDMADPPFTSEVTLEDTTFPGDIGVPWEAPNGGNTELLPATGLVLQGQAVIPLREWYWEIVPATATAFIEGDPFFSGDSPLGPHLFNSDLVLTWRLSPEVEELELVVDPVDYETWLPEGYLADPSVYGNSIKVRAELRKKGGGPPGQKAEKFIFELANVSREPGVCLNSPSATLANTDLDLKFESTQNFQPLVSQPIDVVDALHAETLGVPSISADVNVSSFDFGAFGTIKVTAVIGGTNIVGYLKTDATRTLTEVPLPRRVPSSFVADFWKEQEGVTDQASNADSETDPTGDGHEGDGFTLYEEYRGFSVNGEHHRANPKKKELFLLNDAGGDVEAGIALFAGASRLILHRVLPVEFGIRPDFTYSRILNYNHSGSTPHAVDQHGIWIVNNETVHGYAQAESREGASGNSTPGTKSRLVLDPGTDTYQGTVGSTIVGSSGQISVNAAQGVSYKSATIAHELAHCCSAYHHGDQFGNEDPLLMQVVGGPYAGSTYTINLGGTLLEDGSIANGTNLVWTLLNENGSPRRERRGNRYGIGQKGGVFSGADLCLMRYDKTSNGYFSNTDAETLYLLSGKEPAGFALCVLRRRNRHQSSPPRDALAALRQR